jgi:hypothetical protein
MAVAAWLVLGGIHSVFISKNGSIRSRVKQFFWDEYWGANATQGQLLILGLVTFIVYHTQVWWGVISPPELQALIAIAGLVLTSSPPAYEHDVATESWVKRILTFGGMFNAAALLGTTMSDVHMCHVGGDHECMGPSTLLSVVAIIAICIAALRSSRLSRTARWRDFMEMHPPLSLIQALKRLNQLRRPSLRDDVVELFCALDDIGASALLASYANLYDREDAKRVHQKAVKETKDFFKKNHEDYPHEPGEDEEGEIELI